MLASGSAQGVAVLGRTSTCNIERFEADQIRPDQTRPDKSESESGLEQLELS